MDSDKILDEFEALLAEAEDNFCDECNDFNEANDYFDEFDENFYPFGDGCDEDDYYVTDDDAEQDFRNGEYIFAKDISRSLDDRVTRLNNNVLVVGASGCGKSTGFVEPNIMTAKGSYIISDPKGTLYRKYADYLYSKGYDVLKIDFQNPENSMHWNPLTEIHST